MAFARRLEGDGESKDDDGEEEEESTTTTGADYPWVLKEGNVNQGRGITILAPNSPELLRVPHKFQRQQQEQRRKEQEADEEGEQEEGSEDDIQDVIVQKYVCNEMTWNKRKFDVRVFWLVASIDPLIVLYHDGYVRIGNSDYSETDFSDTTKHLTTHTKLGAEGKATFEEFAEALQLQSSSSLSSSTSSSSFPSGVQSPVDHVRNQMKAALGEMIERFRDVSFVSNFNELPTDNSYSFYCADFILDNDLDVWFLEPQVSTVVDNEMR